MLSANIVESANTFLKNGQNLLSKEPFTAQVYPGGSQTPDTTIIQQIELNEALRIINIPNAGTNDFNVATVASSGHGNLVLWSIAALGLLGALYFIGKHWNNRWSTHSRPLLAFATMGALLLFSPGYMNDDQAKLPTNPPWDNEPRQSYANPYEATLGILHGIIQPAIMNIGQKVDTLPNIQKEVALPMKQPSDGVQYALKIYGFDGWGNRFNLSYTDIQEKGGAVRHYTVTSFGPDKEISTADDIVARFTENRNGDMKDKDQQVYYLIPNDGGIEVLYHRLNHDMFRYNDKNRAETITGSDFFDIIDRTRLGKKQKEAIEVNYAASANKTYTPIILQLFNTKKI